MIDQGDGGLFVNVSRRANNEGYITAGDEGG